jgi:hypothetical protein
MPEFLGKRLGPYLLQWTIDKVWSYEPKRFWVHTCSLDHASAKKMYENAGFVEYETDVEWSDDPKLINLN